MKEKQLKMLKRSLMKALVDESRYAWECGVQNCAGPIEEDKAKNLIEKIFRESLLNDNKRVKEY